MYLPTGTWRRAHPQLGAGECLPQDGFGEGWCSAMSSSMLGNGTTMGREDERATHGDLESPAVGVGRRPSWRRRRDARAPTARDDRAEVIVQAHWQPRHPLAEWLGVARPVSLIRAQSFCAAGAKSEHEFEGDRRRGAAKRRAPTSGSIYISSPGWRRRPQQQDA